MRTISDVIGGSLYWGFSSVSRYMTVVAYCFLASIAILAIAVLVRAWLGNMNRWQVTSTDILYYFMWALVASILWPVLFISSVSIIGLGVLACILVAGIWIWMIGTKRSTWHL